MQLGFPWIRISYLGLFSLSHEPHTTRINFIFLYLFKYLLILDTSFLGLLF